MHIGSQAADMLIALLVRFSDWSILKLARWKVLRVSAFPTALVSSSPQTTGGGRASVGFNHPHRAVTQGG